MLIESKSVKATISRHWRRSLREYQLTKISWAGAIGISVGIFAAVLSVHRPAVAQNRVLSPAPFIVSVRATSPGFSAAREQAEMYDAQGEPELVARLKTRNRRLEALVMVLRQRAAERH